MDAFNFSLSAAVEAVKGSRKKDKKGDGLVLKHKNMTVPSERTFAILRNEVLKNTFQW